MMKAKKSVLYVVLLCSVALLMVARVAQASDDKTERQNTDHRAPELGADLIFAVTPSTLGEAWSDTAGSDAMGEAFKAAGLKTLRFSSHGYYSTLGPEATEEIIAENKVANRYPWFPLERYIDFIARHGFTTVFGVNVEESPEVAYESVQKFIRRGLKSKLVAIELSNEPWLSHRPWLPEEYGSRAADVIERLTPLGVPFALPLTVGKDNNTPTRLSDDKWNERMLRALTSRIDLKKRTDIYGVLHLYSRGMRGESVDYFNRAVRPFAPNMRYLITEFNIRLNLDDNPHLTNKFAMEFARKMASVMARPEVEAMYIHAVPYHSIMYWSNGKKFATVNGHQDERLKGEAMSRGWHLTPTGKVYELFSRLSWNGQVVTYSGNHTQSYWAVRDAGGRMVITLINDSSKQTKKRVEIAGQKLNLVAPPRSIVCYGPDGQIIEQLLLPY
jgi:hypothetical protein